MLAVSVRASALALLAPARSAETPIASTQAGVADGSAAPLVRVMGPGGFAMGFRADGPDLTQMKLHLYERAGRELGVDIEKFSSLSDYGAALKAVIGQIKLKPGGEQTLTAIAHNLWLDKLGVSLDTLIGSIDDPEARTRLDAALTSSTDGDESSRRTRRIVLDDAGAYGRLA